MYTYDHQGSKLYRMEGPKASKKDEQTSLRPPFGELQKLKVRIEPLQAVYFEGPVSYGL
jgi:hypothetical protein